MKKIVSLLFGLFLLNNVLADEGMIIPSLIKAFESDMKAKGMRLSAEDIYSINSSSLKDAIFQFGGGCTAEVVSDQGLLLTNHHCGYSQIQSHSSLENNYIENGYWAKNLSQELKNPGLTAMRIVRIENVTEQVLIGVTSDSPDEAILIKANIKMIIENATKGTHYTGDVKAFNYGNEYYLMLKETFLDVRFVGTPPNSIGKFGGDTDNWIWPRHTGDFSVFRIYTDQDNKPASYSSENKPYTPLHFLPISMKDKHNGDFTMVYGFPGSTEQHVCSSYLEQIITKERPARIHMRDLSLSVIDKAMKNSELIRIQYASKQARISNAWKKWIGQIDGLKRLDAVSLKKETEEEFIKRANSNSSWKQKYGETVGQMNALADEFFKYEFSYAMGIEYFYVGAEYFKLIRSTQDFIKNYSKYLSDGKIDEAKEKLIKTSAGFFKNYNKKIDQEIFELLTKEYFLHAPVNGMKSNSSSVIYNKSVFTDQTRFDKFITQFNKKSLKKVNKDPGFIHYSSHYNVWLTDIIPNYRSFSQTMDVLLKKYVAGKLEMFPERKNWPDANSTLRITFGQLEGSEPSDGKVYTEHTTLDGIIAKYNSGNPDFDIKPRMLELHNSKDYGPYAQGDELWVCFSGSNHTTGGNSGSPVIDADGYLIGINFDRSWESTMSDYMFDPNRCRNIAVDIRYVLWVIDKYSQASHLIKEMDLKN
ncbi:MAG: S46 family peptidase [Crocinitomicaceae bacterium]|tara:strand:+ start:4627 stop:6732 length:2106 start_codon:yes stop_codon:yes gene_type:complete